MTQNIDQTSGPPPSGLYVGQTVHVRHGAVQHRLAYRIFQLFIDPDSPTQGLSPKSLLKINQAGLMSWHQSNHGAKDGSSVRAWLTPLFANMGLDIATMSLRLLCFPSIFGHVFNPLAVHFAFDANGVCLGIVYEVSNTFGEHHAYVSVSGQNDGATMSHWTKKAFHVSPFYDRQGAYQFSVRGPDAHFKLSIQKITNGVVDFVATEQMNFVPFSEKALWRLFLSIPFIGLKVVAAIHFEALKLWIKGAKYHPKPDPLANVSATHPGQWALAPSTEIKTNKPTNAKEKSNVFAK